MSELLEFVSVPLQYPFMVRGLLAAVMVGIVCAVIGTFVVLRGMAMFGGALAHAILPGVAGGYIVNQGERGSLFWWGLATAVFTSFLIGRISKGARLKEDTAMGIVFAGMFALGIAMISTMRSYAVDLAHFLFGDVLGVSSNDLLLTTIFGGLIVLLILVFFKEFMIISFDSVLAATLRIRVGFFHMLMLVMMAITIVISLQTVGIALMVAMLVTPAATAYLLCSRLSTMMAVAALIGSFSGLIGLYLSFYFSIASGAAIVLVCTAFFGIAYLIAPERGLIWRILGKRVS